MQVSRARPVQLGWLTPVVLLLPTFNAAAIVYLAQGQLQTDPIAPWRTAYLVSGCLIVQLLLLLITDTAAHRLSAHAALFAATLKTSLLAAIALKTGGYSFVAFYVLIVLVAAVRFGQWPALVHLLWITLVQTAATYWNLPLILGIPDVQPRLGISAITPAATLCLLALVGYASWVIRRLRYLETLSRAISDGVLVLSEDGTVLEANRQAAEQAGRQLPELLGRSLFELCTLPEGAHEELRTLWSACLRNGHARFEMLWQRPDGSTLPAELVAARVEGVKPVRVQAFTRDMSRWKEMAAAIERQNEELRRMNVELARSRDLALEASRLKSRFLATMSHELRTPLNSIIGYTKLLLAGPEPLSDQVRQDLECVLRAATHLLDLINGLLDLARIEAGKETVEREAVELRDVATAALESVAPLARQKELPVRLVDHCSRETVLCTDRKKLWRILVNLLSNAVRFTEEGEVVLELAEADGLVVLRVRDTGIGIPAADLPHIFDEFHQVKNWHRQTGAGTGLGLAITKRLVELLGGTILVTSEPGRGSTFEVRLPLTQPAAASQQPAASGAAVKGGMRDEQ